MMFEVYSVLDKAVGAFLPPVFVRSRGEMMRSFTLAVNTADHQFHKHATDYTLFYVCQFDDAGGRFVGFDGEPHRVIGALEVLEQK